MLLSTIVFVALIWENAVASNDFVEDEDGSLSQLNNDPGRGNRRFKWRKCRTTSDCSAGYYCHGRWCRPRYTCSINAHCPANSYCDTSDNVCKPGQKVCKVHRDCGYYMYCKDGVCAKKECYWHRHRCPYGHECVSPGLCKLRKGYCKEQAHCSSNQCCLKYYGPRYAGVCSQRVRPDNWCDLKGKQTCGCAQGYSCKRYWGNRWGRCTVAPTTSPPQPTTPEPTEEPGSGEIES